MVLVLVLMAAYEFGKDGEHGDEEEQFADATTAGAWCGSSSSSSSSSSSRSGGAFFSQRDCGVYFTHSRLMRCDVM